MHSVTLPHSSSRGHFSLAQFHVVPDNCLAVSIVRPRIAPHVGYKLTVECQVVPEVDLPDVGAVRRALARVVGDGVVADGEADDGADGGNLHELGLVPAVLGEELLVDVVGDAVAVPHGAAAALDAGPLDGVAAAEVVVGVGDVFCGEV